MVSHSFWPATASGYGSHGHASHRLRPRTRYAKFKGVVWGGASERQRGSGSMVPPGGVGFKAGARGGVMRALAAGCAGSSECGAWATEWRHPGRPRFAGCQPPHGPGLVRQGAAVPPVQRWQRQAPPHAGKGWAGLQQKNAWPSSLAGRTEHADAEICRAAPSRHAGNAPGQGGMACADGADATKRQDGRATHTTMTKTAKAAPMGAQVQQGLGGTGPGLARGNPRPGSGRQEAWQAAAVTAFWVSLQQLALSTLGLRK